MNSITLDTYKNFFTFQNVMIIVLLIVSIYLLIKIQQLDNNKKKEDFYADSINTEAIDNLGKISGNIMKDDNLIIPATTTTMTNLTVNEITDLATAKITQANIDRLDVNGHTDTSTFTVNDYATIKNLNMNGTIKHYNVPLIPRGTMRLVNMDVFNKAEYGEWTWCNEEGYGKLDGNGGINWSKDYLEGYTKIPKIPCIENNKLCYMMKL